MSSTMTAPTARPTRETYRGHNRPAGGFYFGADRGAVGAGRLITLHAAGTRVAVLDATTGEQLADLAASVRFWLTPAGHVTAEQIAAAAITAAHIEADLGAYLHWATSGRDHTPGVGLTHATLSSEQYKAAQRGDGALALAIADRIALIQPAHDVQVAEHARQMDEQRARVAVQRAAAAELHAEVVIVPCGGAKLDHPARAGELYTGSYHAATRRAAAAIAERTGARVLILSALHGLLELDQQRVAPYDLRMGQRGSVTPERVLEQARSLEVAGRRVTVLAGRAYADVVSAVWPDARRPLDGTRGIGQQLSRLAEIARGGGMLAPAPDNLVSCTDLRAGDVCAPGAFGPWNTTDTITITSAPVYCDSLVDVDRYDIGYRVNLRTRTGPACHGALRADAMIPVVKRGPAVPAAPEPAEGPGGQLGLFDLVA